MKYLDCPPHPLRSIQSFLKNHSSSGALLIVKVIFNSHDLLFPLLAVFMVWMQTFLCVLQFNWHCNNVLK